MLSGQIRIVILDVQGDQVRIGIDAPKSVDVLREEIYLSQEENRRAAESVDPDALSHLTTPPAPRTPALPKKPEVP